MSVRLRCMLALVVPLTLGQWATAQEAPDGAETKDGVSYYRDVRPIFQASCQGCHQPAKDAGKFVLTTYALLMEGSRSDDPIITAGKPDESLLFTEIIPQDGKPASMPKNADPLSESEVAVIRQWILEGAKDDSPESEKERYSPENPPVYEHLPVITSIDYSSDGEYLAVAGFHEVLVHKADGSELVTRLIGISERIQSVRFSPDGRYLAATGGAPGQLGEVQIWDVERERLRASVPVTFDTLYGVSWSRDGKLVAFGGADNSVRAIDAKNGKEVLFQGAHNDIVLATTFSPDSSHLVSVGRDRSMKLIEVGTQRFVDNITSITPGALKGGLMAVECHPERDELVIGGADGIPKLYRMHRQRARKIGDDYNLLQRFEDIPGRIFSVRFNPAGTQFVTGSSHNGRGEVRLYQPDSVEERTAKEEKLTDEQKNKLIPHLSENKYPAVWKHAVDGAIFSVAVSPDGKVVAAAGFDGQVRLLNASDGKVIRQFVSVPGVEPGKVVAQKPKAKPKAAGQKVAEPAAPKKTKKRKTRKF